LYASARDVLRYTPIQRGSVLLFDELVGFEGYEDHELRALRERYELGLRFEWLFRGDDDGAAVALIVTKG
jgi:predicted ATPase